MKRRFSVPGRAAWRATLIRRVMWIGVAVAVVVVGAAFVRAGLQVYQLREQKAAVAADLVRLRMENRDLVAQRDRLHTDAAAARLAREELGWTRPNETLVIVVTPTAEARPSPTPTAPPSSGGWWQRVFR